MADDECGRGQDGNAQKGDDGTLHTLCVGRRGPGLDCYHRAVPSLGLAIIARDEEAAVPLAIASARPYVDEVVVAVDSRTTDRTRQVAEDARVFDVQFVDFAQMRETLFRAMTADWILMLDADEILEGDPRPLLERPAIWEMPRRHWADLERTQPAAEDRAFPDRQARLFPNDARIHFVRPVHELPKGLRVRRTKSLVIHHLKEALRDPPMLAARRAQYRELLERGLGQGHRYRRGKDY